MSRKHKQSVKVSVNRGSLNPDIRKILEKSDYTPDSLCEDICSIREELKGFFDPDLLQVFDAASLVLYCIMHPEYEYGYVKFNNGRDVPVRKLDF